MITNLIVKTLLASQLTFIATAIHIPDNVVSKLNTMFFKFVWNRNEAVKRKTIISDFDDGGINMFYVSGFFDSLKLSWVKKITNNEITMWKTLHCTMSIKLASINMCSTVIVYIKILTVTV